MDLIIVHKQYFEFVSQATARLIDGKIVIESEKFTHVREIRGEEMIEVRESHICPYYTHVSIYHTSVCVCVCVCARALVCVCV